MKANLFFLTLGFLLCSFKIYSQYQVSGKVIDEETKECLIGVNLIISGTNAGTSTDQNCHFVLNHNQKIEKLTVSYTGYKTKEVIVTGDNMTIELSPSAIELDQVIVTASRVDQNRTDIPSAMTKLPYAEIDELKANFFPQILQKVSNLHVADFGNEQQSLSIRQPLSFARTQLVILEDGIPLGPVALTTSGDMSEINSELVKEIEVIRGPTSSLYGSEAIGGAVNFILRNPSLIPTANVSILGNDMGYKRANFYFSNSFKKLGLSIGGYYSNRRNGYRDNSDFDKIITSFKATYPLNLHSKLTATFTFFDYQADFAGSLDSLHFFTDTLISFNPYTFCYVHDKGVRTSVRLDHDWNTNSKSFLTFFYRYKANEEVPTYRIKLATMFPKPKYTGEFVTHFYNSYGLLGQHKYQFKFLKSSLIGGLSIDFTPDDYYSEVIDVTKTGDVYSDYKLTGTQIQDYNAYLLNSAAYIQYEINPLKHLRISTALRYDRLDYRYDNHLTPTSVSGAADTTDNFRNLSPKIGLIYQLKPYSSLYASYGVGFAPPLFTQLYKTVTVPVLKPSVYDNYEIGGWLAFHKKKGYFDISLFQSNGKDEIVEVVEGGATVNKSAGKTLHRGIESTLKYRFIEVIELRLAGSYTIHEFVEFNQGTSDFSGNEMNLAPRFIANGSLTFKPSESSKLKGLRLSLEWQHISSYFMDEKNSEKYDGYRMFNLRGGYKYKSFEIWIHVLNLTDELIAVRASKSYYGNPAKPIVIKSYSPGIPRTIEMGLGYNFSGKNK